MDSLLIAATGRCGGLGPIVSVIKALFRIIQIFVPIALLVFAVIVAEPALLAVTFPLLSTTATFSLLHAQLTFLFVVFFLSILLSDI